MLVLFISYATCVVLYTQRSELIFACEQNNVEAVAALIKVVPDVDDNFQVYSFSFLNDMCIIYPTVEGSTPSDMHQRRRRRNCLPAAGGYGKHQQAEQGVLFLQ